MQMWCQWGNVRKGIEVGVFTGYSLLCTALGIAEGGKIYGLDISEEWTSMGQKYFEQAGVANKIEVIIGDALATMQRFIDEGQAGTFDYIFIDADKVNYDNYYELAIQLLRVGGSVLVDNTIWFGKVYNPEV
jgi:predicted O-methyltransferase YrrM